MNIERIITHNALQLLVNKNDPTLFDNAEVFEKNLLENGASKSDELEALKQSLSLRLPWEVRKYSNNLNEQVIKDLSTNFADKSKVNTELATWVVETWLAVLGLKKKTTTTASSPNIENNKKADNLSKNTVSANTSNSQPKEEPKVHTIDAVPFDKIKGRLGIVFGEDSTGEVKVFNTWYDDSNSTELSLSVTPVKLESEPIKPFKTAPKRKKQEKFLGINKKNQKITETNSSNNISSNSSSSSPTIEKTVNAQQPYNLLH